MAIRSVLLVLAGCLLAVGGFVVAAASSGLSSSAEILFVWAIPSAVLAVMCTASSRPLLYFPATAICNAVCAVLAATALTPDGYEPLVEAPLMAVIYFVFASIWLAVFTPLILVSHALRSRTP